MFSLRGGGILLLFFPPGLRLRARFSSMAQGGSFPALLFPPGLNLRGCPSRRSQLMRPGFIPGGGLLPLFSLGSSMMSSSRKSGVQFNRQTSP